MAPVLRRAIPLVVLAVMLFSLFPVAPAAAADPPQYRAYWVDAFHDGFKTPQQIDKLLRHVRASNMNAVIVQVRRRGDAYFSRSIEPRTDDRSVPVGFDPLEYLIQQAHSGPQYVEVHAWVAAFPVWRKAWAMPRATNHVINQHGPGTSGWDNWLSWSVNGTQHDGVNYSLDPGHPAAVDYNIRVFLDLVQNYDVDGLHLDYIRYGYTDQGYNPVNVDRFNRAHGRSGWPAVNDAAWVKWRQDQVTNFVRQLYLEMYALRPEVKLSAALIPWGGGPVRDSDWPRSSPMIRAYQDWRGWLEEGIIDLGIPMVYFRQHSSQEAGWFEQWIEFAKNHQYNRQVILGPGSYLSTPSNVLTQIWRALAPSRAGNSVAGVSLYSYAGKANNYPSDDDFAWYLTSWGNYSPFRQAAAVPDMTWKSAPTQGHLMGQVVDLANRTVEGATVSVSGPISREMTTDATGFYGFVDLPPGRYLVTLPGRSGTRTQTIEVTAGSVERINLWWSQ